MPAWTRCDASRSTWRIGYGPWRYSFRALAEGRGLELLVDVPEGPLLVQATRRPSALVMILVDNALEIHAGARIGSRAALAARGSLRSIDVDDTGIGIAAADQPRVFDRFFRADKARSRDSGGAGLGLSIATWIAERHGGRITIGSDGSTGCRVRVAIPWAG